MPARIAQPDSAPCRETNPAATSNSITYRTSRFESETYLQSRPRPWKIRNLRNYASRIRNLPSIHNQLPSESISSSIAPWNQYFDPKPRNHQPNQINNLGAPIPLVPTQAILRLIGIKDEPIPYALPCPAHTREQLAPPSNHVLSRNPKVFGRSQQMRVIRIHRAETGFGSRRQMHGIGRSQKHRPRQLLVDLPNAGKNVRTLRNPLESARLNVRLQLANERRIRGSADRAFSQLPMECSNHLRLPMRRAGQVVGGRQRTDRIRARVLVIQPHQIAGIEVDHRISRPRSSPIISVESVPPCSRARSRRKAGVYVGSAKNGCAGSGDAGTILAIS